MKLFLKLFLGLLVLGICNHSIRVRIRDPHAEDEYDSTDILKGRRLKDMDNIKHHPDAFISTKKGPYDADALLKLSKEKSKLSTLRTGIFTRDEEEPKIEDDEEEDQYIIVFKEDRGPDETRMLPSSRLRSNAGRGEKKGRRRREKKVLKLTKKEAKEWNDHEDVDYVEIDRKLKLLKESTPYGIDFVNALHVDDDKVSNRKVCILDSGYDYNHRDLPKGDGITGESTGSNNISWDKDDWTSHGTHVAGIIAAVGGNNIGTVGVTRNGTLQLHIIPIFKNKKWIWGSDLVSAVESCIDAGANIVNMSLGGLNFKRYEEETFGRMFEEDNLLLVAAAGNDGTTDSFYPASYDSVISVGAIDKSLDIASFSQKNDDLDLVAPGVNVKSTLRHNRYGSLDGTSMASAHVAGVAALVWSHFPEQSAKDIRDALLSTAQDLGDEGKDQFFGHGLVSASRAFSFLNGDQCTDMPGWHDSWGEDYDCLWYSFANNCEDFGSMFVNFGMNAQQACCICGGGTSPTESPSPSPINDDDDTFMDDSIGFDDVNDDGNFDDYDDNDDFGEFDDPDESNDDGEFDDHDDNDDDGEFDDPDDSNDDGEFDDHDDNDDDGEFDDHDDNDDDGEFDDPDDNNDDGEFDDLDDSIDDGEFDVDDVGFQSIDDDETDDCENVLDWFDSWGPSYDCSWYAIGNRCQEYGFFFWNMGHTAMTACCICKI